MLVKEIPSVGISGIEVKFNHSELVVLKGMLNQLKEAKEKIELNVDVDEEPLFGMAFGLIIDTATLLSKMLPENVMSITEAYDELFTTGEEESKPKEKPLFRVENEI